MAAAVERKPQGLTPEEKRRARAGQGPMPVGGGGFEVFSWLFMRISGLFLVFLALVHFSLMHIRNDVRDTDFDFVVARWGNPFWRVWDWLLLSLALLHGVNGLRIVLEDYIRDKRKLLIAKTILYTVAGVAFVVGTVVVLTFGSLLPGN